MDKAQERPAPAMDASDLPPPIKWARRKWPYLPSGTHILWVHNPSPIVKFPLSLEVSMKDAYGARMGVGFDQRTGRVLLIVDDAYKDLIYDCYG